MGCRILCNSKYSYLSPERRVLFQDRFHPGVQATSNGSIARCWSLGAPHLPPPACRDRQAHPANSDKRTSRPRYTLSATGGGKDTTRQQVQLSNDISTHIENSVEAEKPVCSGRIPPSSEHGNPISATGHLQQVRKFICQGVRKRLIESRHGRLWRQIARFCVVNLRNSRLYVRFPP